MTDVEGAERPGLGPRVDLERSIVMLDWLGDIDLQRRAQIGLNKGESD
ncbi:hypothetical protein [Mesorhizobium tianshanense]|uniref:Uncharacterized protein n=1 Tax=Mesorhizobium tianshanense TaxID=39844 RepID=A0A562NCL5_9HYPH|nr:hypothetical protein [Mesorhizobium tianshanense]TWI29788.1 hypothetical protein IQ26_04902 [Mesorhizobium tianshanense]